MKRILPLLFVISLFAVGCRRGAEPLPVMSFNFRLGVADDGDHSWVYRREAAAAMIGDQAPAVFGVQEAYDFQLSFIADRCPGYACVGVGREDGLSQGEHMAELTQPLMSLFCLGAIILVSNSFKTSSQKYAGNLQGLSV